MNTDKLREIIDRISEAEKVLDTQGRLSALGSALTNLVSQPQNPDYQNSVSSSLTQFSESMAKFREAFSPRDFERVLELSDEAFSDESVNEIKEKFSENTLSPNVVSEFVNQLHATRTEIFSMIDALKSSLRFFDFEYEPVEPGTAEVGFQIPRELFQNNLDGLIKELKEIRRIIQFFSEASVGEYHPAKVSTISTTDPLFFFELAAPIATYLAGSVTWALGVWFSVEKIRNIRAQTAQLNSFTEAEVEEIFGQKIKDEIESQVEAKVTSLLEVGQAPQARKGELSGQLTWALNALLAKIERGMTVELRIAPPPVETSDEGETTEDEAAEGAMQNELQNLQDQLQFPSASDDPVLELPKFNEEE